MYRHNKTLRNYGIKYFSPEMEPAKDYFTIVNLHLQAIYREGELIEQATCKDFLQVRKEGLREVQRKISLFKSIKKEPPERLPHV